jgi:hypothetical protein
LKKIHKIVLATVLVAVMLIASIPVIALAQKGEAPDRQGAITARVAAILGIDQQDLENALKQARMESQEETLDARLQELIAQGTLTQEQANEFKTWMAAKPDVPMVPPGQLNEALDKGIITQGQVDQLKAWMESKPDVPAIMPTMGERLVEEGVITQQQADEYKAWMESRPADIPTVGPRQLKQLLDEGKLTQAQADAYKAWLESKPDMPKIRPELRQNVVANLQERRDDLITRVAAILTIDKEDLENAFKQAQSELRETYLNTRLQELVNQGKWTQQQADQYKAWIKARPDVPRIGPMGPGKQSGLWEPMGPEGPCGPIGPQE